MNKETPVTLIQPSIWKRDYELKEGERILGSLSFPSILSDHSIVKIGERTWVIDTKGVFNPVAIVKEVDAKKPLGTVSLKPTRGMYLLKLPRYRTLRITTNMWKSEFALKTTMNAMLVTLKKGKSAKFNCEIEVNWEAEYLKEYPWLVYLVGYVALLAQRRHG